jgi:signal transduction histidine kinase
MPLTRSLKDLLLVHELIFILLVALAGAAGGIGIHLWDRSSQESQRINRLIQEIQQTRGDLYRQMKEIFDAYFLADEDARQEYDTYRFSVERHFEQLRLLAEGQEEQTAIAALHDSYNTFVRETSSIFDRDAYLPADTLEKRLNSDLESGVFHRYEVISARAERLLVAKQQELQARLQEAKRTSITLLTIPLIIAVLLLLFSRVFLKRAIVRPIEGVLHATTEISAGRLEHKAPEAGTAELVTLARAINHMAEELARSQEALIRTEKQAVQGLLVPMLAHNIRNPLASIRATAQVADSNDLDSDTREALQGIISSVDRLERWTGSLLSYLHPLRPHPAPTRLQHIVEGALIPLQQKLRERDVQVQPPTWRLSDEMFTDEHLLEQALYNLLLNAIEAAPAGSVVEMHAEISETTVKLVIADRGPGIPFTPDPRSVSPGPTTKRFGTGLGIPFAYKVCEALAGELDFSTREGGGTLTRLQLPRYIDFDRAE